MHRSSRRLLLLALAAAACSDGAARNPLAPTALETASLAAGTGGTARKLVVTTAEDEGAGSLRAAIAEANADTMVRAIKLGEGLGRISPASPIVYTGRQPLYFDGGNQVIDGSASAGNGLTLTAARSIIVRNIAIEDAADVGLALLVPADAEGVVQISLEGVRAQGNGGHGILINDQAAYLQDPDAVGSEGSAAAVRVDLRNVASVENGFSALDRDGIRINEGGLGSLIVTMKGLTIAGNGGDGVELDERGEGSAEFVLQSSRLTGNGGFAAEDYDDGIDVDEADAGDIIGRFIDVTVSDNFEQGVDLNENHAGDMRVELHDVVANGNREEGIEFEEDDDFAGGGDIVATLRDIVANGNGALDGDAGLKVREKGDGNVVVTLGGITANDNAVGGIQVREDAGGNLMATLRGITAERNAGNGIQFDENGNGTLTGRLIGASATGNGRAGVQAEQATSGTGTLLIAGLTASGNVAGSVVANPAQVTVTITP